MSPLVALLLLPLAWADGLTITELRGAGKPIVEPTQGAARAALASDALAQCGEQALERLPGLSGKLFATLQTGPKAEVISADTLMIPSVAPEFTSCVSSALRGAVLPRALKKQLLYLSLSLSAPRPVLRLASAPPAADLAAAEQAMAASADQLLACTGKHMLSLALELNEEGRLARLLQVEGSYRQEQLFCVREALSALHLPMLASPAGRSAVGFTVRNPGQAPEASPAVQIETHPFGLPKKLQDTSGTAWASPDTFDAALRKSWQGGVVTQLQAGPDDIETPDPLQPWRHLVGYDRVVFGQFTQFSQFEVTWLDNAEGEQPLSARSTLPLQGVGKGLNQAAINCINQSLETHPDLSTDADFLVSAEGKGLVRIEALSQPQGDPGLTACLTQAMKALIKAPAEAVAVQVKITFFTKKLAEDILRDSDEGADMEHRILGVWGLGYLTGQAVPWAPETLGGLSEKQAAPVLLEAVPGLQTCADQALAKLPTLTGRAAFRMVIAADGRIARVVTVGATWEIPGLSACMEERLSTLQFPASSAGRITHVVVPVLLAHPEA